MNACATWCCERHERDDDLCIGPGYDVESATMPEPLMLSLEERDGQAVIVLSPTTPVPLGRPETQEGRDRTFTLDQARELQARLGELLDAAQIA